MQKYVLKQKIARAKAGDADVQCELGRAYLYGDDIKCNAKKGEKYLLLAAAQSHAEAQFELGKFYLERDTEKAENWLVKAVGNGSGEAAYIIGLRYYDGERAPRNLDKAIQWYEVSAKRGHIPSITMLGAIYKNCNDGRAKVKVRDLLTKAAEQGVAEAQYELALCYYGKDMEKTVSWLEKSAKGNFFPAYEKLAFFYAAECTDEGNKKAVKAFTVAAGNGCKFSALQLGNIYYDGRLDVRREPDKAFYWYQKAESEGLTGIAKCYLYGVGTERDYAKAFKILLKEAEYGALAKYELGNCYYNGRGVEQDKEEAEKLWRQSAEQGYKEAEKALEQYFN